MTRLTRLILFALGGTVMAVAFVLAALDLPHFGTSYHPYRDLAVPAAVQHHTANVVSAVNFDQRAIDTFGEESILIASVVGAAALLRPSKEETERLVPDLGRTLQSTRLIGYVLLPVTLVIGFDVVLHGGVTPGGGFQGGVVLATGLHLLYVAGSYPALDRLRPVTTFEIADSVGAAGFAVIGLIGLASTGAFLGDFLPQGALGQIVSTGTVQVLSGVVGVEVVGGMVVLLSRFFEQEITVQTGDD
ncbi:MAG TPA: MnhB domain-containing protein [Nocardioides sp.]|uniref:MnhB domain-containing protein n=1 Tax=Nocardioides sp. TaxID=35761 RepID=UPI002F401711